jgi:hypothetical protein
MELGKDLDDGFLTDIRGMDIAALPDDPHMKTALDLVLESSRDASTTNNGFNNSIG